MCANYWNLKGIAFTCPACGEENKDETLQTHFMGDLSSDQYYALNEPVPLLEGITVTFNGGRPDSFTGDCPECFEWFDFDAEIVDGRVARVWPIAKEAVPA